MFAVGKLVSVTVVAAEVAVQPLEPVRVTLNEPAALTEMVGVVAPLLHA